MTVSLADVHIQLIDIDVELVEAWRVAFQSVEQVSVHHGSIFSVQGDAIVSPANSFGYMDGALDLRLSEFFGWDLEKRLRKRLVEEFDGELPVGQALLVPTYHDAYTWLVSAPTMRVPMSVETTANAYLAFRAILRAIREHNGTHESPIRSLVCTGLGTGVGCIPPKRCAKQMRYAYDVCVRGKVLTMGGLAEAARNHMNLIDYESPK